MAVHQAVTSRHLFPPQSGFQLIGAQSVDFARPPKR